MNKRLSIIGSAGIPNRYGGFETLAQNLVLHLNKEFNITVYCSTKFYKKNERKKSITNVKLFYVPLPANGFWSVIYDMVSICHAVKNSDVLLILGISGCILLPFVKIFSKKKIIVHIDGIEWQREKWNVLIKKYMLFSAKIAFKFSDKIIVDNKKICDKIYLSAEKANIIEYGGDHTKIYKSQIVKITESFTLPENYFITVARFEPENNIHIIINAFKKIPEKNIVIVGDWKRNRYGKKIKKSVEMCSNIYFAGAIYNQETLDKTRSNAFCCIHGHKAGGTNPSLVEAMWLKKVVVAYDTCFNRETTENRAVYFKTADDIVKIIATLNNKSMEKISADLKKIAIKRYNWKNVIHKYEKIINLG